MLSAPFLTALARADAAGMHLEVDQVDAHLIRLAQTAPIPNVPMPLPPAQDRVTRLENAYNRLAVIVNQIKRKLDELEQGNTDSTQPPATMDMGGLPQVDVVPGNTPEVNVTV